MFLSLVRPDRISSPMTRRPAVTVPAWPGAGSVIVLFLVVAKAGLGAMDWRRRMYDHGRKARPQAEKAVRHGRLSGGHSFSPAPPYARWPPVPQPRRAS